MCVELRELRSNEAIRRYHRVKVSKGTSINLSRHIAQNIMAFVNFGGY